MHQWSSKFNPCTSATQSARNLLDMQILRPSSRCTESETLGGGRSAIHFLVSLQMISDVLWSLKPQVNLTVRTLKVSWGGGSHLSPRHSWLDKRGVSGWLMTVGVDLGLGMRRGFRGSGPDPWCVCRQFGFHFFLKGFLMISTWFINLCFMFMPKSLEEIHLF